MTCREFRNTLDKSLTHQPAPSLSEEMRLHRSSCKSCSTYYDSLVALHSALLDIPKEQIPPDLPARLKSIQRLPEPRSTGLGWMPEVKRGVLLLGPAAAMVAASWLPPSTGTIVQFCILMAGLTILLSNILKPAFINNG
ncbi:MAG TPA: hypothetical protein VMM37_04405 [Bacteroidota bacterium]|nr:hypothetical protein [Bacteroidota bacterium]